MEKYLRNYAEPEAAMADWPVEEPWANVLVVPACNETPELLRRPPPCPGRSLLILVINEPEFASPQVTVANRALAAIIHQTMESVQSPESAMETTGSTLQVFRDRDACRDVILVDRFSQGHAMPPRSGVGQARKIGCDLALALFEKGHIRSPWIHCSDGDVRLPETYFECLNTRAFDDSRVSALIYPFEHVVTTDTEPDVALATQLYELSLRYYVAGLRFARSPYAFHTIGSTLAVNARHYAQVRGFPKRDAGEDFYLLNKLAKVGEVQELASGDDCLPIQIRARRSDRVPFGTGAAVNTISGLADPVADYRYYHPNVFSILKLWLQSWPEIWAAQSTDFDRLISPPQPGNEDDACSRECLVQSLHEIGTVKALEHAFRQSKDLAHFTRHMHTWFDAFKTLKLIHGLRNTCFSSIDYRAMLAHPGFEHYLERDPDLELFFQSVKGRIRI